MSSATIEWSDYQCRASVGRGVLLFLIVYLLAWLTPAIYTRWANTELSKGLQFRTCPIDSCRVNHIYQITWPVRTIPQLHMIIVPLLPCCVGFSLSLASSWTSLFMLLSILATNSMGSYCYFSVTDRSTPRLSIIRFCVKLVCLLTVDRTAPASWWICLSQSCCLPFE